MKNLPLLFVIIFSGNLFSQPYPYPFEGYLIYDYLVSANHPSGCDPNYVTGLPDDSTWVNMLEFTIMTGFFENAWVNEDGPDLLLESSFHLDNYSVRLILEGGELSDPVIVSESDWTELPFVSWQHMFPGCVGGSADAPQLLHPMDFEEFGITDELVTGIEITFLVTPGRADFAGAYIIIPPCGLFTLGPDVSICPDETVDIDATTPLAIYLWQDGTTQPIYMDAGPGVYWVAITIDDCTVRDTIEILGPPFPDDFGPDIIACEGEIFVLDVTAPNATYLWHDNSQFPFYQVSQEGTYAVTVTIDGCEYEDEITFTYNEIPEVDLGSDLSLCEGDDWLLNAFFPNATYQWQDNSNASTFTVVQPGLYGVTVSIGDCIDIDEIMVSYFYPDEIDLGDNIITCTGEEVVLDAYVPDGIYHWQDNSNASTYLVTESGLYAVTVTQENCIVTDEIEVEFIEIEPVNLGPDFTICEGQQLFLEVNYPGGIITWQDQSTGSTYTVSQAGTYSVLVEVDGCFTYDEVNVSYLNEETAILGNDTTLCGNQVLLLDVSGFGTSFIWQDQSTLPTFLVSETGVYSVTVTNNGCESVDSISVTFEDVFEVNLGNDTTLCEGQFLILTPSIPGTIYTWQDNSILDNYVVNQEGSYWVVAEQGDCYDTDTIYVHYEILPPLLLGNDTTMCDGEAITLSAEINDILAWQWNDQSMNSTLQVTSPGLYWVIASGLNCSTSDSIQISYVPSNGIDLGNDTTVCSGAELIISPFTPGASHIWQDQSTGDSLIVNQPGIYWVLVQQGQCASVDSIVIMFESIGSLSLGNDTTLCDGQSLWLNGMSTNANTYLWQDNSTNDSLLITAPGSYWVTATASSCSVSDTIGIDFISVDGIDLGNDTTICEGEFLVIGNEIPNAGYLWQDNSVNAHFVVDTPGIFWVEVSAQNCVARDSISVSIQPTIDFTLGPDLELCEGTSIILNVAGIGESYLWQDQSTNDQLTVSDAGTYWVEVESNDCYSSDTINIEFISLPQVDLGNDTTLCIGSTLELVAPSGYTYNWQDNSNQESFLVTTTGEYYVEVNNGMCTFSDTILIEYLESDLIDLGNDTSLCTGDSIMLELQIPGATFEWQDGSTNSYYQITDAITSWVIVEVNGCTESDTIHVSELPIPVFSLGSDTTLCEGEGMLLVVDPLFDNIIWQNASNDTQFEVSQPGIYWASVEQEGCLGSDTIVVNYQSLPEVNLGNDTILCDDEVLELNIDIEDANYLWSDGSNSNHLIIQTDGIYHLSVSVGRCSNVDSISVEYSTLQYPHLGEDLSLCEGESLKLHVENVSNAEYIWSNNSSMSELIVSSPGTYWVEVNQFCGSVSDTIMITSENCGCKLIAPNVFTPDGNGTNDIFTISTSCELSEYELSIFDRYGGLLYRTQDEYAGWDGTMNGKEVQSGVYVYLVHYREEGNGERKLFYGDVTLIR